MDGRTKPLIELRVPVTYNFLNTFEVSLSNLILQENVWGKPKSSVWSAVSGQLRLGQDLDLDLKVLGQNLGPGSQDLGPGDQNLVIPGQNMGLRAHNLSLVLKGQNLGLKGLNRLLPKDER